MELLFTYREHLKEYTVEEDGYYYYMPYSYIEQLQEHCKELDNDCVSPVEKWYESLKEIERKVVAKKPKDEVKLSSIW